MSATSSLQFDIHAWNNNANAELLVEFQKMTATLAGNREKPKGFYSNSRYLGGVPTSAINPPVPRSSRRPASATSQHMFKTISFAIASTVFAELPAVMGAENRLQAIGSMIGNILLAALGAGATVAVVEAIERGLQGACKDLITKVTSNLAAKVACGATGVSALAFVSNTLISLYHLLGAKLALAPKTAESKMKEFWECWSSDQLVRICVSSITGCTSFAAASALFASSAVVGVTAGILYACSCALTEHYIMESKNERGGWGAWVRSLIVPDERPRAWSSEAFDAVKDEITTRLICPITGRLVVDPVVYIDGTEGYIYERQAIYDHLEKEGKDYLDNVPASCLKYKRSPVATRLSAEFARQYDARLVLVDSLIDNISVP